MPNTKGYTLIELLIILVIISALAFAGLASFGDFSKSKALEKETLAIKTFLRTAFGNATSGLKCQGQTAKDWSVDIAALNPTPSLYCSTSTGRSLVSSMPALQATRIRSITGASTCETNTVTVTFASVFTAVSFGPSTLTCIGSTQTLTIVIENIRDTILAKTITITKGGAVNVQ